MSESLKMDASQQQAKSGFDPAQTPYDFSRNVPGAAYLGHLWNSVTGGENRTVGQQLFDGTTWVMNKVSEAYNHTGGVLDKEYITKEFKRIRFGEEAVDLPCRDLLKEEECERLAYLRDRADILVSLGVVAVGLYATGKLLSVAKKCAGAALGVCVLGAVATVTITGAELFNIYYHRV